MKETLFLDANISKIDKKDIIEENKTSFYKTTHYIVSKDIKKSLKKEVGDYFVLDFKLENLFLKQNMLRDELARIIKSFLKKYSKNKKVLIIGLGNDSVIPDSLGVCTTNKLIATNLYKDLLTIPKIALFNPSITEKTGIDSFNLIKMVVEDIKPDVIFMIDSMYTKSIEYLSKTIEVNDTGIIPGSLLNSLKEINKKTFNIPIITIGMPLVLKNKDNLMTSFDIKHILEVASDIIADSLKKILL